MRDRRREAAAHAGAPWHGIALFAVTGYFPEGVTNTDRCGSPLADGGGVCIPNWHPVLQLHRAAAAAGERDVAVGVTAHRVDPVLVAWQDAVFLAGPGIP